MMTNSLDLLINGGFFAVVVGSVLYTILSQWLHGYSESLDITREVRANAEQETLDAFPESWTLFDIHVMHLKEAGGCVVFVVLSAIAVVVVAVIWFSIVGVPK